MGTYNYSARELADEISNLLHGLEGDFTKEELSKALDFVAAEQGVKRTKRESARKEFERKHEWYPNMDAE